MKRLPTYCSREYVAPVCVIIKVNPLVGFLNSYTIPEIQEENEDWD